MAELLREAISRKTVEQLSQRIEKVYKDFDSLRFNHEIITSLGELALTERTDLIAEKLKNFLPDDFPKASQILIDSLGDELDDKADDPVAKEYDSNCGFIVIALCTFIKNNGLNFFNESMSAFYEMTKRFSAEGAIREFIIKHEKETLELYSKWTKDKNVHIRRLVSESLRPRLPWAPQLPGYIQDPTPIMSYLNQLKDDKHLYVRRSVANNLNDITKDNPHIALDYLEEWNKEKSDNLSWLTKHALRTLIKKGNKRALNLIGISSDFKIELESFSLKDDKIKMGSFLDIDLQIISLESQKQTLLIDYIIHHQKANGKMTPKVFKWTKKDITKDTPLKLNKKHAIKEITTRKYYSGEHKIEIQINGKVIASQSFWLEI